MKRLTTVGVALALLCASVGVLHADVKTRKKDQVTFEGMLGRMAGMFGGSAARDGVVSSVAVVGDRKLSLNDASGEIIDLAEERVYRLDVRRRTYTIVTFAELRRQMEEAQAKARKEVKEAEEQPGGPSDAREMEVDFDIKDTGQRKAVAGYDTRQLIATITVRQKGMTLEEGGGMVLTSDMWMADRIAALGEIREFDMKYFQAVYGSTLGATAQQMAAALALYPGLQAAMQRMQEEGVKMNGTPLVTTTTVETVKSKAEMAEAARESEGGGIGGRLARRVMRKKPEEPRARVMSSLTEVLSVETSAAAADVALPDGFTLKK
ncbi:MAG: hypothetical protein AB1635_19185 [Acidobacteriota bacterium]